TVKQRRVIGYVGMTGLATGPHLHYTFYENGRPINPLRINNISADPLKPEQVAPFQHDMMPLLAKLAEIEDNNYAWSGVLY
ncbi:MAG TPA: M23 family metallopeptidase, partial [Bacteroidetes bacterium]|nr:M23 family metallopeptidase [Bacteroidota bacterium]